jgi:hypothetical protein
MNPQKIIMRKIIVLSSIFLLVLAACNKKDTLQQGPNRLFRPVLRQDMVSDGNWIEVNWQPIKGATSYTLQLSRDTFRTIDASVTVDTTFHLFENLKWEQLYQVQVKANATDTAQNSKFSDLGSIKTPRFPTILNIPGTSDIADNAVRVSWSTSGAAVTNIKILKASDSSVVRDVTLSATDVTNQYRIVSSLSGATDYIIFLYSGSSVRGWANFKTNAPLVGKIVDLRDIEGRPTVLKDTLPLVESGSIILLKRGQIYTMSSSIALDKTVKIMSGTDLLNPQQAEIDFTSNFNFAAGAVIDSIEFNDVYMRSDSYGSRYVFNTTNGATVGKLKFMNSKIEIFRGIVRLQSGATTVNNFIVNNCIIDSISNYGVINVDNASCKVDNISITNSTIYKVERFITSTKPAAGSTSVLVSDCTFNEIITGSNILIDYGSTNVTNGITVSNCIFGTVKGGGTVIRDVRYGSATSVNPSNNYRTSDYISAGSNDLPSVQVYPRSSTQLWKDPINGDFTIIDNTYPGRTNTGALRWRQ